MQSVGVWRLSSAVLCVPRETLPVLHSSKVRTVFCVCVKCISKVRTVLCV